jgi:hypothetical protein
VAWQSEGARRGSVVANFTGAARKAYKVSMCVCMYIYMQGLWRRLWSA